MVFEEMLSSIIIEFVASVVGESLAALLAAVAAMFGGVSSVGVLFGHNEDLVWSFVGVSVVLALVAGTLAHRAFQVTNRRHALARFPLHSRVQPYVRVYWLLCYRWRA